MIKSGCAYLVGAGSGDPELLTLKATRLVAAADVILYDRLIPAGVLDYARPEAELIYVGKKPDSVAMTQTKINERLVEETQLGKQVVRLKGGDPFIFGRGGEEALALHQAGCRFEVVPAVTAGVAASAYAGIPVTQRGVASAVAFITGHEDPEKPESDLDWQALASFPGTLVFYMGVKQLPQITAQLTQHGRNPDQPAAVIHRGTQPTQKVVTGTISTIFEAVTAAEIKPPALLVFGDVCQLHEQLQWFQTGPLKGRTVTVTRATPQASELANSLRQLGAEVFTAPTIKIEPLEFELPELERYDLICFTSSNTVELFFKNLDKLGFDSRSLAKTTVAAIGQATTKKLMHYGIRADITAKTATSEGLLDALSGRGFQNALIPQAESARQLLADGLRNRGTEVQVLPVYRTVAAPIAQAQVTNITASDYVIFASASAAENFFAQIKALSPTTKTISIGPITTQRMTELHHPPTLEAAEATPTGLITALVSDLEEG